MSRPVDLRTLGLGLGLGLALALAGCSTLADPPVTQECKSDVDCPENFVCAIDQGRCLAGNEAAPRAHLGFDIRERAAGEIRYRVEVDGCDCMVQEAESIRELTLRRSRVSQLLSLGVSDDDDEPLPARFVLTQPSRFGQLPSPQRNIVNYPSIDDDTMNQVDTVLRWSRYHPLDIEAPRELVLWEIDPEGDLARRYHGLVPPRTDEDGPCELDTDCCEPAGSCDPWPNFCNTSVGQCTAIGSPEWTYHYTYEPACSRAVEGDVRVFDPEQPSGEHFVNLPSATVRLRYADTTLARFGTPVFQDIPLDQRPPECTEDADCDGPTEFCDLGSQQCFLALAGLPANDGSTTTNDDEGVFRTEVYTYCDGEPNVPLPRRFGVTVTPAGPLPSVDYLVDADFLPGQENSVFRVGDVFCVPDWGEATAFEVELVGQPRALVTGGDLAYECCEVDCLPATADDVGDGPPPAPSSCDGRASSGVTTVRASTDLILTLEDLAQWDDSECVTPDPDAQGRVGSLTRLADCTRTDAPCRVEDVAVGTAEAPRVYQVRVESPVGSVLASGDFPIELGSEAPTLQTLNLAPRVLVTGIVDVDATICGRREVGEDCAAREAIVLAERLRMPDEPEGSVPGPYLHTVSTFYDPVARRDGAFVLPLDPGGVYVLTALPPAGAEGGPGNFEVVNLRSDAPEPLESLRLVLEDGVVVTLLLEQFDQRTSMVPVDRGSYLVEGSRLEHPGRAATPSPMDDPMDLFVDLNRVGECWTPEEQGSQACKIRRLIPPGSDLARSQVGQVRFTARRSGQANCPQRCPTPIPTP